jgi:hydrogenase-4 membrane subunit HyfE
MLFLSLYILIICSVAAVLYAAVEAHEPNRRLASGLKRAIVAVAVAAILGHLAR